MEWLVSEIGNILLDVGKDTFKGFWGKIKLFRIKRKLKKELFIKILKQYGDRPFYNELDAFLSANKVIYNIIINCDSVPVHQYQSQSQLIHYYVQLFIEKNLNRERYRSEIYSVIHKCFDVIYNTLNDLNSDENVRVIANIAKELAGELSFELKEIKEVLSDITNKLNALIVVNEQETNVVNVVSLEPYFEYLMRLCFDKKDSSFIPRSLYFKDEADQDVDALDALLKDKNILLLGEAGYGKTYESIDLLNKICTHPKANGLIPFYLPLYEYETIYFGIIEGIQYKLRPFCDGDSEQLLKQWLANGQVVLILDGIDDIKSNDVRRKLIVEAKDFALRYNECYLFVTSRFNRYHGEFGKVHEYFLRGIDRETIRMQLKDEQIYVDIPDSYYQLFENPMFLDIGKKVLKNDRHREIFNRSILFEELMMLLCGEWDKKKGVSTVQALSYSDIIHTLGQYAYDTFAHPPSRLLEFDQYMSNVNSTADSALLIRTLFGTGVLKATDQIAFTHKLFKEYCTAYHIVNSYPLSENTPKYLELIKLDDWKEVFIFASGMFNRIDEQDTYLDFIMTHNLSLYIECINAKSDLSAQLPPSSSVEYTNRYLSQIVKTYTFIVDKYFDPLKYCFDPHPGKAEENLMDKKIRIVGCISHNGDHLHYWFDRVIANEDDVICIQDDQIAEYHKLREAQAMVERKSIQSYYVNLKLSGLYGDSSRKVAINLVKKEIDHILEKRYLIESKYLLCERLDNYKRRIKAFKDNDNLIEMYAYVDSLLKEASESTTNLVGYDYNGIEMFSLRTLLKEMIEANINLDDCILPKEDVPLQKTSGWVWNLYSDKQKASRISKFFYYHQLSYLEMVKVNFPLLYQNFSRYLDAPYQTVVWIYLKNDREVEDMYSEASLTYYNIASPMDSPALPQLRYFDSESERNDHRKEIYSEIRQSYLSRGKEAHRLGYTQTGFTFTTRSNKYNENCPLLDHVYSSIKTSLEEVFGRL